MCHCQSLCALFIYYNVYVPYTNYIKYVPYICYMCHIDIYIYVPYNSIVSKENRLTGWRVPVVVATGAG